MGVSPTFPARVLAPGFQHRRPSSQRRRRRRRSCSRSRSSLRRNSDPIRRRISAAGSGRATTTRSRLWGRSQAAFERRNRPTSADSGATVRHSNGIVPGALCLSGISPMGRQRALLRHALDDIRRRTDRLLGCQGCLQLLAAGHRDSRGRVRRKSADHTGSDMDRPRRHPQLTPNPAAHGCFSGAVT